MNPTIRSRDYIEFVHRTSGRPTDPIADIERLQGRVSRATVETIRRRIEAEVQLITRWNIDAWHHARVEAEVALVQIDARIEELKGRLVSLADSRGKAENARPFAILLLLACVTTCLGAEFAWTVQTLPFLLDLDRWSPLGIAVSALPVGAVTAMEWALAALFLDRIRGFRSDLHAGRVSGRAIAIAGCLGVAASGAVLLALNITMVTQLGGLRALLPSLGPEASGDAFAHAETALDAALKILGVVVAVDTAVLLMALQEELQIAAQSVRLGVHLRSTERGRTRCIELRRDGKTRYEAAAHEGNTEAVRAQAIGDEYRARALAILQRKLDSLKPQMPRTIEDIAAWQLSVPPAWNREDTPSATAARVH